MKTILIFLFIFSTAWAQPMSELLKGIKIDKAQMKMMITELEKSGQISKKGAAAARTQIKGMKQSEINALSVKAVKMLENSSKKGTPQNKQMDKAMKMLKRADKQLNSDKLK